MISKLETDSEEQWYPVNRKRKKKINSKTKSEAIIETIPSEQSESNLNKKGLFRVFFNPGSCLLFAFFIQITFTLLRWYSFNNRWLHYLFRIKINSKTKSEAIIETIPSEQSESNLNKKGKKKTRPRIEKNSKQIMKPAIIETIPSEQSKSNSSVSSECSLPLAVCLHCTISFASLVIFIDRDLFLMMSFSNSSVSLSNTSFLD
jgi:hypothetical protein